ncbi:exported hypothetical protein [Xanthomonas phaseoli pv. phaseoli]|uniref:Sensor protein CreC n=1 Tax=Xanthomonas campestris pv. phaseoli TaxID=317013 RepID=A0AB38E668_XANCH|nr:exported hypothetical protein [Xanthomonas phaseoli pv. phaseoli]SON91683.1 exported hypothetical protein [Xanthomonas phaseoli pv. phaseoli]SON93074.1 exported hypothetical protein [Xanthomonas phaseoli pv. phaseoli]SOO30059.1 exported hypothetical protein [Xanthomonas phaseoli pv. phaseoli]
MRLGLKLFLGFFLIVGLAAFFVMRVFVNEVKPGVRQAMESTLVDAANVLAEIAGSELAAGTLADGSFARNVARAQQRDPKAWVWRFRKNTVDYRVTVTDARGVVVFDSLGRAWAATTRAGTMSTAPCAANTARVPARRSMATPPPR